MGSQDAKERSLVDFLDIEGETDLFAKARAFSEALKGGEGVDRVRLCRRPLVSACGGRVVIKDPFTGDFKEMIMMASNSYFGLTTHPQVIKAAKEALEKYGYGTGSVSLLGGTTDMHIELERRIASYYGCEDATLFPTGYSANVGTISAIAKEHDTIVNDIFNHASIYDGCRMSGADVKIFVHASMHALEKTLKSIPKDRGRLIITDGVFSMDGDIAKLDKIYDLAKAYNARVMIDEAHSLGIIGATGRGTAEHFGLQGKIDITLGTLSKTPGSIGGYVTGSKELINYLRFFSRSYFFSTSLPVPVVAGLIEIFKILETDDSFRKKLWENIHYMSSNLKALGYDICNSETAIIPLVIGDELKMAAMASELHQRGIFLNFVTFPAVPKKRCRLRISLMAQHTRKDLDEALEALADIGRKYQIIK
jgi:glycine C-acetyltransferase